MGGERGRRDRPKSNALLDRPDVQRDLEVAQSLGLTLAQFDRLPNGERSLWLARRRRERETCPDCGNPVRDCSDPKHAWFSFRRVCYVTMERSAANEMYKALHEAEPYHNGTFTKWSAKPHGAFQYHYDAGVTIGVTDSDLAPWDKFTTEVNASPVPHESPASEAEIHEGE